MDDLMSSLNEERNTLIKYSGKGLTEKNLVDITYGKNLEEGGVIPEPSPSGTAGGAKDFEAEHVYIKDTLIFHDNHLYRAKDGFKSGAEFNIADWEQVAINGVEWSQIQGDITEQEDLQTLFAEKVNKSGDTMTGALVLNGAPAVSNGAANKQYVDDIVAQLESQALTFIGFVSTIEPTVDVREGNLWYQPAAAEEMPDVTFPWLVRTYTSGAWSVDTTTYIPSALDMWDNLDNEQSYFYFGDGWKILDFNGSTFDPDKFVVNNGVVSIKPGAITDADVAVNAQIQASKISGLDEQLAIFSEGVKGTIVGASESDGIGYVKADPDGKGKVTGLVEMNSLLTMGPPDWSNMSSLLIPSPGIGTYTVPANGYIKAVANTNYSVSGDWRSSVIIDGNNFQLGYGTRSNYFGTCSLLIPVKKDSVVEFMFNSGTGTISAWFIPPVINPPAFLETMPLLDYSTVEQDTGRKFIDGKEIYQRTNGEEPPAANLIQSINHPAGGTTYWYTK